jgi:hypothetical protein
VFSKVTANVLGEEKTNIKMKLNKTKKKIKLLPGNTDIKSISSSFDTAECWDAKGTE